MKKLASVLAVSALVAAATVSYAGMLPATGINGSMHDLNSAAGYNGDDFGRVCAFCHTPHNATSGNTVSAPLWNHAPSAVKPDPYAWAAPANQSIAFNEDPLVGPSRLCMGCHDGVTAVDSHGAAGSFNSGNHKMTASYVDNLGNTAKRFIDDLTVTHPIGFKYSDAVAARNLTGKNPEISTSDKFFLADVTKVASWNTNNRTGVATGYKKISDTLYNGDYFTCASCHDVHNTNNAVNNAALTDGHVPNYFLWAPEQGSTICLSCHIK